MSENSEISHVANVFAKCPTSAEALTGEAGEGCHRRRLEPGRHPSDVGFTESALEPSQANVRNHVRNSFSLEFKGQGFRGRISLEDCGYVENAYF